MEYTEKDLSQWFDAEMQKPWEPGVYEVSMRGYTPDEYGCYAWWDGLKWGQPCVIGFMYAEESRTWEPSNAHRIFQWRGLNHKPSAHKPKPKANKRKTMHVVVNVRTFRPCAAFDKVNEARDYAERVSFPVRVIRTRFRVPA